MTHSQAEQDYSVKYYNITFDDLEGRFVVAKIRRVSSPPVMVGSVPDFLASSLGRLTDIFRLGKTSRNYSDLQLVEWLLLEQFGISAEEEWTSYLQHICRIQGVEHLDRLEPQLLKPTQFPPNYRVAYHHVEMNNRPYVVARIGEVFGGPAAVWLTLPKERESALARLADVFRIGVQGQVFRDFRQHGCKEGKSEADILCEWKSMEGSVAWEAEKF